MSEFSDSYHLRTNDRKEAVKLLERAGLKGFVFPESNGWITLVAEGEALTPNEQLINVNEGTLIHFVNAEDYGWYFSIYEGSKRVCHYECMWSDDIEINDSELDMDVLLEFMKNNMIEQNVEQQEIESILHPASFEEIFEEIPISSQIASFLGLENYEWVSFHYVEQDYHGDQEIYSDLICVE